MKKLLILSIFSVSLISCDVLKMLATEVATDVLSAPSSAEAAGGLKDALKQGFGNGVNVLSAAGGFNKNSAIRILLPTDAQKIADKLRSIGMGSQVDKWLRLTSFLQLYIDNFLNQSNVLLPKPYLHTFDLS